MGYWPGDYWAEAYWAPSYWPPALSAVGTNVWVIWIQGD
jgi:hypothetical protein